MDNQPPTKKSLGQHWLNDTASLEAMVKAADVQSGDVVLEIGPGPGALTELLVARAERVVAVEFDKQLAADLPSQVPANNLQVVQQDILTFDLTTLPPDYKVVANIPYYLTSNLLRVLSDTPNPPIRAALLIQKEVAERVAAAPGSMSLLSVATQMYWQVSLGQLVPAELFLPPPKVDSQILMLERRAAPLFPDIEERLFFRLVRAGFSQRRKTLLNALSGGMHLSREAAQALCADADIEPGRRAQTLSLEEWHQLYRAYRAPNP